MNVPASRISGVSNRMVTTDKGANHNGWRPLLAVSETQLRAVLLQHLAHLFGERQRFIEGTLPDVAPKDEASRAAIHSHTGLMDDIAFALHLAAAEENERAASRLDDLCHGIFGGDLHGVVRLRSAGVLLRIDSGHVDLHDVGAKLIGNTSSVVYGVEAIATALGIYRFAARICPHDDRHAEAVGVFAHLAELLEVVGLQRRADVEGVTDGVGAEAHGIFDGGSDGGDGLLIRGDLGLAIQLQDQRYVARILLHVLLSDADLEDNA